MISSVANWLTCGGSVVDKWIFGEGEDNDETSSSGESNSDDIYEEEEEEESEENEESDKNSEDEQQDGEYNDEEEEEGQITSDSKKFTKKLKQQQMNALQESEGVLYGWGYNYFGQVGNKTNSTVKIPTQIQFPNDEKIIIKMIACGDSHTLAISTNGSVYSWGVNRYGQLGQGDQLNRNQPTLINFPSSNGNNGTTTSTTTTKFNLIGCGSQHSMIVSNFGELYTFGCGNTGRLGHGNEQPKFKPTAVSALLGKEIVSVSAGVMHTACVDSTGKIYSFGWNRYGQLGNGTVKSQTLPKSPVNVNVVTTVSSSTSPPTVTKELVPVSKFHFTKVVCGKNHTLALCKTGEMVSFGFNACGQLGNGNHTDQLNPTRIEFQERVIDIASGYYHCLCLTNNGEAYSWGYMSDGSLGLAEVYTHQTKPKLIPLVHIRHQFFDSNDAFNEIYGKQDESSTQETIEKHKRYLAKKYSIGDTVDKISAGAWNSAIITSSGKLYSFGFGDTFRNGNGLDSDQDIPVLIEPTKWGCERSFNIKEDTDINLNNIIELEKEKRILKFKKKQLKEQQKQLKENDEIGNGNEISNNENSNNNVESNLETNLESNLVLNENNDTITPNIVTNKINLNSIKVYSRVSNISIGGAHTLITVQNKLKK